MEPLGSLMRWYHAQCDGVWEHAYGVKIDTLDNPGWSLSVDIIGTKCESKTIEEFVDRAEYDWLHIRCDGSVFVVACGPKNLGEAILYFTAWADNG